MKCLSTGIWYGLLVVVAYGTQTDGHPDGHENDRWLFLGDSITQNGSYVDYIETWLLLNEPDAPEIIDLGLSSETVSGISEPDHPFPRPDLHQRLDRILNRTKPKRVIACYGMNCGIYHPFSKARFNAYKEGVRKLITKVHAQGADVILLTPPPYAGRILPREAPQAGGNFGYKTPDPEYNVVLAEYAKWVLSLDNQASIRVIDIRPVMEKWMPAIYVKDPIHPNALGHELMAEVFLQRLGYNTGSDILQEEGGIRAKDTRWLRLIGLVRRQRMSYDRRLLNDIGHGNPRVRSDNNITLLEAEAVNANITEQIRNMLRE